MSALALGLGQSLNQGAKLSSISRKFGISLSLMISMLGALFSAGPAVAYPQASGTYTGTSTVDGFTAGLQSPIFSPYSDCRVSTSYALTGGWFYKDSSVITVGGLNPGQSGAVSIDYMCNAPEITIVSIRFSGQALTLQDANIPQFGAPSSREGGFVVQITNYDPNFTYSAFSSAGIASIVASTGIVQGLGANTDATLTVTASRTGYRSGSSKVTGRSYQLAPAVQLGEVRRTADGFELNVLNVDQSVYYAANVTPGTAAFDRSTGLIRVTGLTPGQTGNLTIVASGSGTAEFVGRVSSTALLKASSPTTLSSVVNEPGVLGSFSVTVTNYDPAFAYSVTSSSGTASMSSNLVSVTGAAAGSAVLTIVKFRSGYEPNVQTITHEVPGPPQTPLFPSAFATNATTAFVTWGSVDGATGYTVSASLGGPGCTATSNSCTITGLTSGSSYTFSIVATNSGLSSPAATTAAVVMGDQLVVGGSVSGSTWKVGTSVTASPLIIGQYSILNYQWYRCSSAVGTQVAPPACEAIGGASAPSYTLSAADVGKFVTAHLSATGGVGVVTKTLSNGQPALAIDAAGASNVDPEGKPVISNIPDKQVSVVGGTEIVVNGTGFTGVTSVTVNGVVAKVIKATDTSIVVSIPASTTQGLVDLVVTTPKGATTAVSALAYVATPIALPQPVVTLKVTKTTSLKPYLSNVVVLSASQKKDIKSFIAANSKLVSLKCVATTSGVKKSSAELKAAVARAKNACAYAKILNVDIKTSFSGIQGKTPGKVSKLVKLTLSN